MAQKTKQDVDLAGRSAADSPAVISRGSFKLPVTARLKKALGAVRSKLAFLGRPLQRRRKILLGGLALVLIGVLACVVTVIVINHRKKPVAGKVVANYSCSTKLQTNLKQAAGLIDFNLSPDKTAQLQKIVDKIKKTDKYTLDPNCLYPMVFYYIKIGDPANAQTNLDLLKRVYNPPKDYSAAIGYPVYSVKVLESDIKFLQDQSTNWHNNSQTLRPPKQ